MPISVPSPDSKLRIKLATAVAQHSLLEGRKEVGILNFDNLYTSVLAEVFQQAKTAVHIWTPVFEEYRNDGLRNWCMERGYHYEPVNIRVKDAAGVGLLEEQPSLLRAAMYLVARKAKKRMHWVSIPEELRIIKTPEGWMVAKNKSLRMWYCEFGPDAHLMWSNGGLAECYMRQSIIHDLVDDKLPGKRSNRSSDRKIWTEWFPDLGHPTYDFRLALKPLWEHYSGELMMKNEHNISQITAPYNEVVETLWLSKQ